MTNRFTTVLAEETMGSSFSPAGDFLVQVDVADKTKAATAAGVQVDIEARVDSSAAWVLLGTINPLSEPIANFTKMPYVRYHVRNNVAGNSVTVWDNG
jgi:hypothetical protein